MKKVVLPDGKIQERVWLHKPTGQLGYGLAGTVFGNIWFFAEHDEDEVISGRFANFLDDPRDQKSLKAKDFQDLGPL